MKTWLITDTHFGHHKLVSTFKTRPPGYEMEILASLKVLDGNDVLIHLGDFCIGKDEYWIQEFMKALPKGTRKILVRGNHDKKPNKYYIEKGFHLVCDSFTATYFGKRILFSHAPVSLLERANLPLDMNIHGHMHGNDHRIDESVHFYAPPFHKQVALEWTGYNPLELEKFINKNQ